MKLKIATIALSMMAGSTAFAGAANADLNCKSADGVIVKGSVPGDFAEFELTITKGGKSARLFSVLNQGTLTTEQNANMAVVSDLKNGVWTLSAQQTAANAYGFVQIYALPKTVKSTSIPYGYKASFTGKLDFNLSNVKMSSEATTVNCTLKYEI